MNKKPTCKICKIRKVEQQEWKTEEEKAVCFTCNTFAQFLRATAENLQIVADEKRVNRQIYITLWEGRLMTPEERLLAATFGKKPVDRIRIANNRIIENQDKQAN